MIFDVCLSRLVLHETHWKCLKE